METLQENTFTTNLFALTLLLIVAGSFVLLNRGSHHQKFYAWFNEVKNRAPYLGYSNEEIEDFNELNWYQEFIDGMSPGAALEKKAFKRESV